MAIKKKNKTKILIISLVLIAVLGFFLWIFIKVNQVRNKERNQLAVEEPTYEDGFNRKRSDEATVVRENLTESFFANAEDSLKAIEQKKVEEKKVEEKAIAEERKSSKELLKEQEEKRKKLEEEKRLKEEQERKAKEKKEINANPLLAEINKIEEQKQEPKPVVKAVKREEPKDEFGFNFIVVKEDDQQVSESENEQGGDKSKKKENINDKNIFAAKIYGNYNVKAGESVILRNTENVRWRNQIIPEGSVLYGTTTVASMRMKININRVVTSKGEFKVELKVYDRDYQEGIFKKELFDAGGDEVGSDFTEEVAKRIPSQVIGSAVDVSTKKIQKSLKKIK